MPTTRKRHMITETDPVQEALAPLRARGCAIDFRELVILGARTKLAESAATSTDDESQRQLRERFLALSRPTTFDLAAALEVRDRGWARD